ncbi:targeted glyoxalase II [Plasmodium sp. gorilla clade G1]|nr:targeted glyoxalase II [Plasmodium sp. gorilla clade G1]
MRFLKTLFSLNCLASVGFYKKFACKNLFFENSFIRKDLHTYFIDKRKYFHLNKKDICTNTIIIPFYKDNYSYIFYDDKEEGIVVDPADYNIINDISKKENIKIKHVLCTHKHSDHNNGNQYYYEKNINVYGIKEYDNKYINQDISNLTHFQINNFKINIFLSNFHSKNQVSYLIENDNNKSKKKIFFTGDFLFISGIGKNFEQDNEDLYNSINKLKLLDKQNIYIFCGHEYTLDNLKFALTVDSTNKNLLSFYDHVVNSNKNYPTVPTLLEHEYLYNPFLRCDQNDVRKSIELYAKKKNLKIQQESDYIVILRLMKDNFKAS